MTVFLRVIFKKIRGIKSCIRWLVKIFLTTITNLLVHNDTLLPIYFQVFQYNCMFLSCQIRFQSESTLYICLNVNELLARRRREIWSLSDCNWIRIHNHLVRKRTLNHLAKLAVLAPLQSLISIYFQQTQHFESRNSETFQQIKICSKSYFFF